MRYKQLLEAVTTQGFKFGFEFECIGPSGFDINNAKLPLSLTYHGDTSIKPENYGEFGYEFVSEPLVLNPKSIIDAKSTILALLKDGFYTNNSCGFHIHYSYQDISFEDISWILVGLALNPDLQEKFSKFENIEFFNDSYASLDIFDMIKECFKDDTIESLVYIIDDYKYRIIRIHPQGTIEWRGPRDFMNRKEQEVISNFFIRLYQCADLINKLSTHQSWTYADTTITKKQFVNMMNQSSLSKVNIKSQKYRNFDKKAMEKYPWLKGINYDGTVQYKNGSVRLSKGNLYKSAIRDNVIISDSYITDSKIIKSVLDYTSATNSKFENCTIDGGVITNCELSKCNISKNTELVNSKIDGKLTSSQDKISNMFGDEEEDIDD